MGFLSESVMRLFCLFLLRRVSFFGIKMLLFLSFVELISGYTILFFGCVSWMLDRRGWYIYIYQEWLLLIYIRPAY